MLAENNEDLKEVLIMIKAESAKAGFPLNIKKRKITTPRELYSFAQSSTKSKSETKKSEGN